MKKIYNQPESLVVRLITNRMMALSFEVHTEDGAPVIDDGDDILTKEDISVGKSIWDEEW